MKTDSTLIVIIYYIIFITTNSTIIFLQKGLKKFLLFMLHSNTRINLFEN